MLNSKGIKYLKNVEDILTDYSKDVDYVLEATYPINYTIFEKLLEVEKSNIDALNYLHVEFDSVNLSGRQLVNLSNNLNVNILVKNPSDNLMKELLESYTSMDFRKTLYPAKLVVLLTLYTLYYRCFFPEVDIFSNFSDFLKTISAKLEYTYLKGKYSAEYLETWVQWYLAYLVETRPDFIKEFAQHCIYLFSITEAYYKGATTITREPTDKYTAPPETLLGSGLYVPLAFVMRDMQFNPYRVTIPYVSSYDYVKGPAAANVIEALSPIADYSLAVDAYIAQTDKAVEILEDLGSLSPQDILRLLREKKAIACKTGVCNYDLFPLEVHNIA